MNGQSDPAAAAAPTAEGVPFVEAIAVERLGEHSFGASVDPSWDGPLTTHGGILAALILRSIDMVINADDALQVRTLSLQYMRPPAHGPIAIEVEPLRSGRRFANTQARIAQGDRLCVTASAVHSLRGLPKLGEFQAAMPEVAPCPPREAGSTGMYEHDHSLEHGWLEMHPKAVPFFRRLKIAPRFGTPILSGIPVPEGRGDENGGWVTLPDPHPVVPELLTLYVDAFWPSALQSLKVPAMSPTIDLTIHFRAELPPDGLPDQPLLVHNTTFGLIDGTADSDSRVFSADGRLLAQARQLQFVTPWESQKSPDEDAFRLSERE